MNTVRYSTKTTATLIAFPLAIMLLSVLINEIAGHQFFETFHVNILLSKREYMLSPIYLIPQKIGFWSMIAVSIEYAILKDRHGIKILSAFTNPIVFMVIMTVVMLLPFSNFTQLWAVYFLLLLVFIYRSFTKLYTGDGIKSRPIPFIKNLSNHTIKNNPVDYYVILVTKIFLLVLLIALFILTIVYCATGWDSLIAL